MEKSFWKPSNSESFKEEDQKFIDVILGKSDESVTNIVYRYQKSINKLVWSFKDSKIDPEDIFQDGMFDLIRNIKHGDFKRESSVLTYLSVICRNKCYSRLRKFSKTKKIRLLENEDYEEILSQIEKTEDMIIIEKVIDIKNHMNKNCMDLFDLRFNFNKSEISEEGNNKNLKFEEIAKILDLKLDNAKKKFSRCLDRLYKILMDDPELREYYK